MEHFVAGTTARTASKLCGVNRKTASFHGWRSPWPRPAIVFGRRSVGSPRRVSSLLIKNPGREIRIGLGDLHADDAAQQRQPTLVR